MTKYCSGKFVPSALKGSFAKWMTMVALTAVIALVFAPAALAKDNKQTKTHAEKEAAKLDCKDFATQRGAQAIFSQTPLAAKKDRFKLDRDGDGIACETSSKSKKSEDGTKLGAETGGDLDCMDFSSQKSAQKNLRADPSDPNKLDPENNGIACDIRPADYKNSATDLTPVLEAQSDADLDCNDFEYQQEAQMTYFRDKNDPNNLNKDKEDTSIVCDNLPVLASNVEEVRAEGSSAAPTSLIPLQTYSKFELLLYIVALTLIISGTATFILAWRQHRSFSGSRHTD